MTHPIKFGTDGWRGTIAEDYTFANVRLCAQGTAQYFLDLVRDTRKRGLVVGYDTRFASEHFGAAVAEVLAGNGIPVYLVNTATPTPVFSYSIVAQGAAGGINITASHNPPWDNGFKVRGDYGGAVDPAALRQIEARIDVADVTGTIKRMPLAAAQAQGLVRVFDPAPAYIEQLNRLVDIERIRQAGLHVVVDPMWGAGMGWLPRLLAGGTTRVSEIHNLRNPLFPDMRRPEPIPPNIARLQETVVRLKADVGIVNDGDADRVGLVDEHGRFVDQLRVYALLALYLLEVRGWRGPIVKTVSTTSMLETLGRLYDVPVYPTGVGFKYVAPKMLETGAMIGGEESGGYALRDHVPERDGLLVGLLLLDMMVQTGRSPAQLVDWLFSKVGPHYYDRVDRQLPPDKKDAIRAQITANPPPTIDGRPVVDIWSEDGFKFTLDDGSWLLIRFSGTEPIIRVYTETDAPDRVERILAEGLRLAGLEA